jgi:hypothetical protein
MKNLNLDEMQELLPDYAFGKLSPNESAIFKENLASYPELEKEVADIRSAFTKVSKSAIEESLQNKTANLTYKTKQKQYNLGKNKNARNNIIKLAVPAIFVVGIFLYFNQAKQNEVITESTQKQETILSVADLNIIFGTTNTTSFSEQYEDNAPATKPNESLENKDVNALIKNASNTNVYNYINGMSEKEFNQLLDEIDNEDFSL